MAAQGIVFVVGAGPDLPGLMTTRGAELLNTADVVVYDRRAQRKLFPGREAGGPRRIYVGARGTSSRVASPDVALLLVTLARKRMRVVYLAYGDALAVGRGTDLTTALHDANVEFEIVPGVSAGNAAATYAGIPLLAPTMASATVFANGREQARGGAEIDWSAIAATGATLVVRNATNALPAIVTGFAVAGVSGDIPAAAITHAGRASQRTVVATLGTISDAMARAAMTTAVTVIIGWTVLLRDELAWFDTRPLFGVRIVVARTRYGPSTVAARLGDLGAAVIDVPQPGIGRLDLSRAREEIKNIAGYEWVAFSSPDAVALFWELLALAGRDTRALANAKVACIDPATAAALLDHGITVDVVQERFGATALIDALSEHADIPGAALLYVGDDETAEPFARDLEQAGAVVTPLALYREIPVVRSVERFRRTMGDRHSALVVALSPSAAHDYIRAAGEHATASVPAAAYDEATAAVLRDAGIEVIIEPKVPSAEAIVEAIKLRFGTARPEY